MHCTLSFEIFKRIETVRSVEIFVILSVGTFNLAIVSRSVRVNKLVPYTQLFEARLKERKFSFCLTSIVILQDFIMLNRPSLDYFFRVC